MLSATKDSFRFLTASEDTTIRMMHATGNHLKSAFYLEGHTSSVRSLCLCDQLLFSAGGAAEVICWELHSDYDIPASQRSSICLGDSEEEVVSRCLGVRVVSLGSGQYLVAVGVSDATIRLLMYDQSTSTFTLLKKLQHQAGPVLSLEVCQTGSDSAKMLTGCTDGTIAVWNMRTTHLDDVELELLVPQCHQSGVNSISVQHDSSTLQFVSGGDDQAVRS